MSLEEQVRQASLEVLVHSENHWQARLLSLAHVHRWWNHAARVEYYDAQCSYRAVQAELACREQLAQS
jgi:hypothetical protein